ncbi:mercury(II) reductase [Microvenator marinus]|uniref:Mercuric reductase n=1 Tax=Microvenator marinus TaxID=2600177 RepID=A0A5B8XS85_9DELT|nr:mercury(II) reductase [Microvenator marinus]QED28121.1 mercury(II) reductase [Microvenator marinus]
MSDHHSTNDPTHFLIIGGGSAAFAAAIEAHGLGARVTIVNDGLPIGGTCVNVGCVPSKFLLRAAEAHHFPTHHRFAGIKGTSKVNFSEVIAQKRALVESLRQAKYIDVIDPLDRVQYRQARARFVGPKTVEVDGEHITADHILIATGTTPAVPPIDGLDAVDYLTNETAFELNELPESMVILGGSYVGLEIAQIFSRFGTRVTVLEAQPQILPAEANDLSEGLAAYFGDEGIEVVTNAQTTRIRSGDNKVVLSVDVNGQPREFSAERLLVATGRRPNSDALGLDKAGVAVDTHGFITVDSALNTTAENIYAAGDVIGHPMFVYTDAYEGKLAARNALSPQTSKVNYHPLPWVVFTDPQVAGVGFDERQAAEEGFDPQSTVLPLTEVPRAIAARDTRGFIKLIRDRHTDRLLGARILAPEGSELLMEIAVALRQEMTVAELADILHPYLTLSEGIRLAALSFDKKLEALSCCAG